MKNIIRGVIFCALWYLSIIVGFYIMVCPILPLVIISPKKYRRYSDLIFGMWEPFPVAMFEVCFGVRVALSGDKINPFEGSLFVMNHRTRVDWSFLWLGLYHYCEPNAHNIKYTLKAPIMHFPAIGWVMQTCSFIFLYRNWSRDQAVLDQMIDYLTESDSSFQILLFPEGTDKTERTTKKSHKYADEHNLARYYYVLHPKTTGFVFLTDKMRSSGQLKAVYDVTIAYPKTMPQTELDIVRGKFPEEVHFHVKRYSASDLPTGDEGLKTWLTNIWQEKEKQLKKFYATGSFNATQSDTSISNNSNQDIEFGKASIHNGIIKYDVESIMKKEPSDISHQPSVVSVEKLEPEVGSTQNEVIPQDKSKFENYRPPHLLYLVLAFWIFIIALTIHQLINNVYLQIWFLTHSLLFASLSLVSNGFHHIAASIYSYRYKRKNDLDKKCE